MAYNPKYKPKSEKSEFGFSRPAFYQIEVLGKVSEIYTESLSGMDISYKGSENKVVTTLLGKLSDQAALSGVMNALYDMHMSVLSVKKIEEK